MSKTCDTYDWARLAALGLPTKLDLGHIGDFVLSELRIEPWGAELDGTLGGSAAQLSIYRVRGPGGDECVPQNPEQALVWQWVDWDI